ncbi:MAG: GNAT family N-acetyltransferase [Planctomycetes bacterium]|nr:GNAT family N-acetyltransferase [Planctomycetota bacterium]
MFRPLRHDDLEPAARFLDQNTLVLRWLVAFFKHFERLPQEAAPYWSFWIERQAEEAAESGGIRAIVAHSFHTGASFLAACSPFSAAGLSQLCRAELLPEKLTGDAAAVDAWLENAPQVNEGVARREKLLVLELRPGGERRAGSEEAPAFRAARPEDLPILRQLEMAYGLELDEEVESDFESLIAAGLIFVLDEGGKVEGMMRGNLSDGRYVHAGGLYVHPCCRGRGLGKKLILALAEKMRQHGPVSLVVDALESNSPALRTYREAGFREIGQGRALHFHEGFWSGWNF